MGIAAFLRMPKNVIVVLRFLLLACFTAMVYHQGIHRVEPAEVYVLLGITAGFNIFYWFLAPREARKRAFRLLSGAGFIVDTMAVTMLLVSIPSFPNKAFVLALPYFLTVLVAALCRRTVMTLVAAVAGSIGFAFGAPSAWTGGLVTTGLLLWFVLFYISALSVSYLAELESRRRMLEKEAGESGLVREATAALQRALSLYELLAENIPAAILVSDSTGKPVFCNRRMGDVLGVSREEIMRNGITKEMFGRGNTELLKNGIEEALRKNSPTEPREMSIQTDRAEVSLLFRVLPLSAEGREEHLLLLLFEDVTSAKDAEEKRLRLAKVTGELELLMTLAVQIETVQSIENVASQVMMHAEKVFDFSCFAFLEFSSEPAVLNVHLKESVGEIFIESLKERMISAAEVAERSVDEERLKIEIKEGSIDESSKGDMLSYFAVPLASETDIVAILSFSSTESEKFHSDEVRFVHALVGYYSLSVARVEGMRKQMRSEAEAQLARERLMAQEELIERLKRLDALKSGFILTVSHQLRTPLTSIKSSAQLLKEGVLGKLDEQQMKCVDVIARNVERLVGIVNDVLDLSKLEAGKVTLNKEMQGLRPVVEEAVENLRQLAEQRGVTLEPLEFDDAKAFFDYQAVLQILTNLIGNAITHNPTGTKVSLNVERRGEHFVSVSVSDTGVGIPEKEMPRIFDKFYQAEMSLKSGTKGSGLGLAICKELVEAHGGRIWARNNPEGGVTFTFTLKSHPGEVVVEHAVNARELLFGRIAVLLGFATQEQVDECVRIQGELPQSVPIGELMLKKGYIDSEQLQKVLDVQEEILAEPSPKDSTRALADTLFGRVALQYGYINRDRLNECVRTQALRRNGGRESLLGEIMVEKGYLTPKQVANILRYQGAKILFCKNCGMRVNLYGFDQNCRYICKECERPLVVPKDIGDVFVDAVEFDWDLRRVYKEESGEGCSGGGTEQ